MEALQQLISSGEALYIIVSNPTGTRWEEYGDKELLPYKGLTAYEFSGPENMPALDKFLEGQILPQTFRQGEASCIICKPREDIIVGVFTIINGDVFVSVKKSKDINRKIESIFWCLANRNYDHDALKLLTGERFTNPLHLRRRPSCQ